MKSNKQAFENVIQNLDKIDTTDEYRNLLAHVFPKIGQFMTKNDIDVNFEKLLNNLYNDFTIGFDPKIGEEDNNYAALTTVKDGKAHIDMPKVNMKDQLVLVYMVHELYHVFDYFVRDRKCLPTGWLAEMIVDSMAFETMGVEKFAAYYDLRKFKKWLDKYIEPIKYSDYYKDTLESYMKRNGLEQLIGDLFSDMNKMCDTDELVNNPAIGVRITEVIAGAVAESIAKKGKSNVESTLNILSAEKEFPLNHVGDFSSAYFPVVRQVCEKNGFYMDDESAYSAEIVKNFHEIKKIRDLQHSSRKFNDGAKKITSIFSDDMVLNIYETPKGTKAEFKCAELPSGVSISTMHDCEYKIDDNSTFRFDNKLNSKDDKYRFSISDVGSFEYDKKSGRLYPSEDVNYVGIDGSSNKYVAGMSNKPVMIITSDYESECINNIKSAVKESVLAHYNKGENFAESYRERSAYSKYRKGKENIEKDLSTFLGEKYVKVDEQTETQESEDARGSIFSWFKSGRRAKHPIYRHQVSLASPAERNNEEQEK